MQIEYFILQNARKALRVREYTLNNRSVVVNLEIVERWGETSTQHGHNQLREIVTQIDDFTLASAGLSTSFNEVLIRSTSESDSVDSRILAVLLHELDDFFRSGHFSISQQENLLVVVLDFLLLGQDVFKRLEDLRATKIS